MGIFLRFLSKERFVIEKDLSFYHGNTLPVIYSQGRDFKKAILFLLFLTPFLLYSGFKVKASPSLLNGYSTSSEAADITVSGQVTDENGGPLAGVTVVVKGTTVGTVTDGEGHYSLSIPDDQSNGSLVFSFVGFGSQEISINGRSTVNITMSSSSTGLDELVVIGYGTAKKSDVTGAVQQIKADRLVDKPISNVSEALQGKVAGVEVIGFGAGIPGSDPQIRIRGTNSINTEKNPLFVVDGIVGVKDAMTTLNPDDIASVDVLKDASATAIYGARGANGVIIITTKRGSVGAPQVSYNGSMTVNMMNRHTYAMTADQLMYTYMQAESNAPKFGHVDPTKDFRGDMPGATSFAQIPWLFKEVPQGDYFLDLLGNDGKYYAPRFNSNWEDSVFRTSVSTDHNIDIRGGSERSRYSISLGYLDDEGLMIKSYFKRYTARITTDVNVLKWLDFSGTLLYNNSARTDDGGITRSAVEVWSLVPGHYPNDPIYGIHAGGRGSNADFNVGEQWYNSPWRREEILGRTKINQLMGSMVLTAHITKDLSFKTDLSIDMMDSKFNHAEGKLDGRDGTAEIRTANTMYWQNQDYLNYDHTFTGGHNLSAVLGLSWSRDRFENLDATNSVFFTNFYQWHTIQAGAATRPLPTSSDGSATLNSYFARANYSYQSKYLLTATGRIDGSSKFGKDHKYGFFPSIGAGWVISEENFLKGNSTLSFLKLRGSWGRTGNQEIGSYVTQSFVGSGSVVLGDVSRTALFINSVGNNGLKWETTTQYDAGLEFGFLNNRFNLEVDYYHKMTNDMLMDLPLPYSTTVGTVKQNYGKVQNQGFEFTVSTANIQSDNFHWNTSINLSMNRNKIVELGPTNADIFRATGAGSGTSVYRVGEPIGSYWGLNRIGVYSTEEVALAARYGLKPGDLKYEDKNQDGQIDVITDGQVIGNGFPKLSMGVNNTFSYKNFDVSIDIRVLTGFDKVYIHESAQDRQLVSGGLNSTLDAWRPDHQNTVIAQMRPGNGGAYYQSFPDTHMVNDASHVRGSNGTIGYSLAHPEKIGLSRLRIYVTAQNFFLITNKHLEGYDPVGSSLDKEGEGDYNVPNIDKYAYPTPTKLSVGVNVSF